MTSYQIAPNIDLQPLDDSLIALDLAHNVYYALNETARLLIENLIQGACVEQIAQNALEIYEDVELDTLITDFSNALKKLLELGILIPCE